MFKIKPRDDTVTKSIRMPQHMADRLNKLAKGSNVSFTDAVLQCIQYALDSADSEPGKK